MVLPCLERHLGGRTLPGSPEALLKLPHADRARIAPDKVVGYLLSPIHPSGASKARFFQELGFTAEEGPLLVRALLKIADGGEVTETVGTPFGTKYVVITLESPKGRKERLTTVWIILPGDEEPRLVTAYPTHDRGAHHDP